MKVLSPHTALRSGQMLRTLPFPPTRLSRVPNKKYGGCEFHILIASRQYALVYLQANFKVIRPVVSEMSDF